MIDPITAGQIKVIHTLINKYWSMKIKQDLIMIYTDKRTNSCKAMNHNEAKELIIALRNQKNIQFLIFQIIEYAKMLGMAYGNSIDDYNMNIAKIDQFLIERGTVKKELYSLKYSELKKVVTQFKAMEKSHGKSKWNKYLKSTLKELKIG